MTRRWSAEVALVGCAFIWGATFVLVKRALDDSSTLLFLALRFTLASVALGVAFRPLPSKFAAGKPLVRAGLVAGMFLFAGYVFQTVGLRYTTPSKSAFITGLSIVMVPLLAAAVTRKNPQLSEWTGVAVAAVGLGLLTLQGDWFRVNRGDVWTLACAAAFAAHMLAIGHYAPKYGFQPLALSQIAVAAALSGASFWWVEPAYVKWSGALIFALGVTGLLATALAFSAMAWAQQYASPTRTALILALEPAFAALTSFLWAGEVLSARASAGALLILAGIVLVEVKPFGKNGHP